MACCQSEEGKTTNEVCGHLCYSSLSLSELESELVKAYTPGAGGAEDAREEIFAEWVQRRTNYFFSIAYKITSDGTMSEELVDDSIFEVYSRITSPPYIEPYRTLPLSSYLTTVLKRLAYKRLGKRSKEIPFFLEDVERFFEKNSGKSDKDLIDIEVNVDIRTFLLSCAEFCSSVELGIIEDIISGNSDTSKEKGKRLGVNASTYRKTYERLKPKLQNKLQEYYQLEQTKPLRTESL